MIDARLRICVAAAALAMLCRAAAADDLADFNAAVEDVAAHNRTAIGYLHTDAIEMAVAEMEQTKNAWGALAERFGGRRPAVFADNQRYTEALVDVPMRIVTGYLMLNLGRPDMAANSLQAIREELSALRRESGVTVLADCILDANKAAAALAAHDANLPDLGDAGVAGAIATEADALGATLKRCDAMAPASVHDNPTFRRLIEGPLTTLSAIPKAIDTRDVDLLRKTIDELRAFDALLTWRYG